MLVKQSASPELDWWHGRASEPQISLQTVWLDKNAPPPVFEKKELIQKSSFLQYTVSILAQNAALSAVS